MKFLNLKNKVLAAFSPNSLVIKLIISLSKAFVPQTKMLKEAGKYVIGETGGFLLIR